jgi:hypothetical protein
MIPLLARKHTGGQLTFETINLVDIGFVLFFC